MVGAPDLWRIIPWRRVTKTVTVLATGLLVSGCGGFMALPGMTWRSPGWDNPAPALRGFSSPDDAAPYVAAARAQMPQGCRFVAVDLRPDRIALARFECG